MTTPIVSVTATAERETQPDSFAITATARAEGADAAAANDSLGTRYAAVEDAVAGLTTPVEVRRGQLAVWQGWRDKNAPFWEANRAMTLTGRDVSTAGDVMAALAGLPDVQLDGPRWIVRPDNPVHGQLQADAVDQAQARAERYAAALGGALGRLVELNDPGSGPGPIRHAGARTAMAAGASAGFDAMTFGPEDITLYATVQASWELALPAG